MNKWKCPETIIKVNVIEVKPNSKFTKIIDVEPNSKFIIIIGKNNG